MNHVVDHLYAPPKEIINEYHHYLAEYINKEKKRFLDKNSYISQNQLAEVIIEFMSKWKLNVY